MDDRLPQHPLPQVHNLELEQALLGAVLINHEAWAFTENICTADDFFEPLHQHIWEIFGKLIRNGKIVTPTLLVSLIGTDAARDVGGGMSVQQYIARLAAEATTVINAPFYAETMRDLADQRRIGDVGASLRRELPTDPVELATEAIDRLDGIVAGRTATGAPPVTMREAVVRAVDYAAKAYQGDGRIMGIPWGLRDLDAKTLGMQRGEFIVLAGRPGMGKTAVALTVLRTTAEAGFHSMFAALEGGDIAATHRMMADYLFNDGRRTPLSYWLIRSGKFAEAEFEHVTRAAQHLAELPIRIEQQPGMTIAQIGARARQMKRKGRLDILMVDHLHLVRSSDRYAGNRVAEVGETSNGLKGLAKELDCAVVALCQLSRQVESRDDKRPNLSDLRWSGEIEQDADVVLMLYREQYYLARSEPRTNTEEHAKWQVRMEEAHEKLEILVEKQRQGPIGAVHAFCNIAANAVRNAQHDKQFPQTQAPLL